MRTLPFTTRGAPVIVYGFVRSIVLTSHSSLAGRRVEGDEAAVEGADEHLALPHRDAAIDDVAAGVDGPLARHFGIVRPTAACRWPRRRPSPCSTPSRRTGHRRRPAGWPPDRDGVRDRQTTPGRACRPCLVVIWSSGLNRCSPYVRPCDIHWPGSASAAVRRARSTAAGPLAAGSSVGRADVQPSANKLNTLTRDQVRWTMPGILPPRLAAAGCLNRPI